MRTFIFLLCSTVFSFSPVNVLSQNVKVKIPEDKTITVDQVFDMIKQQTDYRFIYRSDMFKNYPKVEVKKGVVRANKLLEKSLAKGDFKFNISANNTITIRQASAVQELEISGTITDENGIPLPGITVYVSSREPGSGPINTDFVIRGTSTDIDGKYKIKAEEGYYLIASGLGYEYFKQQITAGQTVINITLKEQASALDEVVIVGYGSTIKRDLTGSVSTLNSEEVEQVKTQSVERALYGKVPGVLVTGGGRPGSSASVIIRGLSQLEGDNQPLYVIDGIPLLVNDNTRDFGGLLNQGTKSNPLLSINPADIENVSVLKDASAAAIYGSRAANGVIIITTKRGKRGTGKPRFTFSTNSTIQNPQTRFEFLSKDEFIDFYSEQAQLALDNSSFPETLWPFVHPNELAITSDPDSFFGDGETDWQDEVLNDNALWQEYNISLSGGTDNLNYRVSGTISNQEAVFINSKFKRYTFSANIDADVTDKLRVGASINYNNSHDRSSDIDNLRYAGAFRPDIDVYDENGNFTVNEHELIFNVLPALNPVGEDGRIRNTTVNKSVLASVYAELDVVKNLKLRSEFSSRVSNDVVNNYSPSFTTDALLTGLNGDLISFGDPGIGILQNQSNEFTSTVFTNTLTYNNTFADAHTITAVAGLSWDKSQTDAVGVGFAGFPDDFVLTNPASAEKVFNNTSDHAQRALNSLFARVNYNYKDKYLLTLTGRADRSTQFGKDNRTGIFPSVGLAWNVHNESFLENIEAISQFKLRASTGRVGNDNLPAFSFIPVMAVEGGTGNPTLYNDINGFRLQGVANEEIRWEETDQLDIALEFGLFNNRLNGEIVWFNKKTSDLIMLIPISAQTGFANYNYNIADVSNKGWEFLIGGDIFRTEDFTWNSSFNVSFIKNNVDALKGGQSATSFNNFGIVEGYPIGQAFGRDILGIAQTQEEIDALNAGAPDGQYDTTLLAPGDYIARDVNGDGEYTDADEVPLADGNQADFFGGWNNTIIYKNFDVSLNFQFVQGLDKVRNPDEFLRFVDFKRLQNYIKADVENTWSPSNPDALYPRVGSRSYTRNSRFVSDASYVTLRSASIGYNMPQSILESLGVSNLKLTLTGNNLFLIHNYAGPNPEGLARGVNTAGVIDAANDGGWSYPNIRSFTLGLNVTF